MPTNPISPNELEERLNGPQGVTLKTALIQELADLELVYRHLATTGLSRADLLLCQAAAEAAASAISVLARYPAAGADNPPATKILH
ncbi:hypothetical protein [Achromobacter marplatensis]|uniref:hypothetical protein n=1 Tax=Achromobacter marplatensis TaxID=470868 RepID=UPI0039F685B7